MLTVLAHSISFKANRSITINNNHFKYTCASMYSTDTQGMFSIGTIITTNCFSLESILRTTASSGSAESLLLLHNYIGLRGRLGSEIHNQPLIRHKTPQNTTRHQHITRQSRGVLQLTHSLSQTTAR